MTLMRLRNIHSAPVSFLQDGAPGGQRTIEPGEEFEADQHTAQVLLRVAPGVIEVPLAQVPVESIPQLILPRSREFREMLG